MSNDVRLASLFVARHPERAAHALHGLPPIGVARFLASLPREQRDTVLMALAPEAAAACLEACPEDLRSEIVDRMPLSAAAAIMRAASPAERTILLDVLPEGRRRRLERAFRFDEETAGGLADLEVPTAVEDLTVDEALKRSHRRGPDLPYIYATNRDHRLVGVVSRRELGKAKPEARVADIMQREVRFLRAFTPAAELSTHPAWRDVDALPVVDGAGILVGALRHKALRRGLERAGSAERRVSGSGGIIALGTAYCELLARAMLSLTTVSVEADRTAEKGGEL